jgi:hypothetical protein
MTQIPNTIVNLVQFRIGSKSNTVFTEEDIQNALELALRAFNMYPVITYFKWSDVEIIDMITDILVTYAVYLLYNQTAIIQVSDIFFNLSHQAYDNWFTQIDALKTSEAFIEDFVEDSSDDESYEN